MRQYRDLLRAPGVARLLGAAFVGRIPLGIEGLAILLLIRDSTGSYAVAGVVSAAGGFAGMVATPALGRVMDGRGQRGVVLVTALGHPALLLSLVLLAPSAPVGVLIACAVGAGLLFPPLSPALRALLPTLLEGRRSRLDAAYALDAVSIEVFFIVGPLLAAHTASSTPPSSADPRSSAKAGSPTSRAPTATPSGNATVMSVRNPGAASGPRRRALVRGGARQARGRGALA